MQLIIDIFGIVASALQMLVIIWFIIGLLFAFNIVDQRNELLQQIDYSLRRLLDPLLKPIRRLLPETGAVDFSPLVLLILIQVVYVILDWLRLQL